MVINELTWLRIGSVSLGFRKNGSNHLGMAVVATFGKVDIASCQFQRGIRRDFRDRWNVCSNQERWNDFEQRCNQNGKNRPERESQRQSFPPTVP